MPLPPGTTAHFRMADNSGLEPVDLFTVSTAGDIVNTDGPNGVGTITISPARQASHGIVAGQAYLWEFRVEAPDFTSVHGAGKFKVLSRLFALPGP